MSTASAPEADPTLTALVPRPAPARTAAFVALAVAALVAAWFAPAVLRPTLGGDYANGTWYVSQGLVVGTLDVDPQAWPSAELVAVEDVPGARVVDAWIVPRSDHEVPEAGGGADAVDELAAVHGAAALEAGRVPVRLDGDVARLVVVWDVEDCALLTDAVRPEVVLRTSLGTTVHEPVAEVAGPAMDLPTLHDAGVCAAGS